MEKILEIFCFVTRLLPKFNLCSIKINLLPSPGIYKISNRHIGSVSKTVQLLVNPQKIPEAFSLRAIACNGKNQRFSG